jgi:EmrB/QacA subfamily drug resistance transporter
LIQNQKHTPRRLVAALMLTATLNPLNSTMIAVALPAMAAAFRLSAGTVTTWLVTSYLIVNIVAASPAGRLADLLGRRRTLSLGQGVLAIGALVGGLSPVFWGVATGRILMAAGGAMVIPTAMAVLRESFAPERRARVFAWLGTLMGFSAAVGPVLGGLLTSTSGWQAIFLVNAPVLLVAWVLTRAVSALPFRSNVAQSSLPTRASRRFDLFGAGLLVLGLGGVAVGLKVAAWRWGLLPAGALGLFGFVLWEKRAVDPLLDLRLFSNRHFMAGGTVIALQNLSMYALLFQLPFLLEGRMELDPARVGQVLMTMMVAMVVTAPIGGRISESIGVRQTVFVGLGVAAGGLLLGLRAIEHQSLEPLLLCLGGMGLGLGFVMGPVQAAALSAVSTVESGVASGVLSTMRYLGGVFGISIISVMLDSGSEAGLLAGHRLCLWIYIGAHVVALAVASLLPSRLEVDRSFTMQAPD